MFADPKVIVALDSENELELQKLIAKLDPQTCRLKVGKTLFTHYGPEWVKQLHRLGFEVFLDLKFHDIPQQVYGACKEAAELGVWMVNVHALGGTAMLQAAKAAIQDVATRSNWKKCPKLIGVTILTSLHEDDLTQLGIQGSVEETVKRLAKLCFEAGLDGVVCSAKEATMIKQSFGSLFLCVTPGIRLPEENTQDQRRVTTPVEAIQLGSDYLVMGRTITNAASPSAILNQINQSLAHELV